MLGGGKDDFFLRFSHECYFKYSDSDFSYYESVVCLLFIPDLNWVASWRRDTSSQVQRKALMASREVLILVILLMIFGISLPLLLPLVAFP